MSKSWIREDPPNKASSPKERKAPRPVTDYVRHVMEHARRHQGEWGRLDRAFQSEGNARAWGSCIDRGFVRLIPRSGEPYKDVVMSHGPNKGQTRRYLAVGEGFETRYGQIGDDWFIWIRFAG